MQYVIEKTEEAFGQFNLTVTGIPSSKVSGLQESLNRVLFEIKPDKPHVPNYFFIDANTVTETARAIALGGNKINAIKFIRSVTAWDLRVSKDFVDQLVEKSGEIWVYSVGALDLQNFAYTRSLKIAS